MTMTHSKRQRRLNAPSHTVRAISGQETTATRSTLSVYKTTLLSLRGTRAANSQKLSMIYQSFTV